MDLTQQQTALSGTDIDIGAALEFAKSDPDWMKKCGIHGVVMLIPIAGALALFGWGRKVYENAKVGERILPDLDIGGEVSYGIPPLVAMVVIMGLQILIPEIQRRGYNGEMGPLFSPGASIRAVKSNPKAYFMTLIGLFVANFLGSLGAFACYIGMFLTLPFGHAMAAHILAQWDAIVQRSESM